MLLLHFLPYYRVLQPLIAAVSSCKQQQYRPSVQLADAVDCASALFINRVFACNEG
jgi:hypothetical protein